MDALLKPTFDATHVTALLDHHQAMVEEFQQGAWEECISKAGKFVEAVLKALWVHTGNAIGPAREFKVDKVSLRRCRGTAASPPTPRFGSHDC